MNRSNGKSTRPGRRRYLVAMVLGTTLSALGTPTSATSAVPEATQQAVTDISRYCTACWRNARLHPDVWNDCTQEVFCRLLERVSPESWDRLLNGEGEERRELIRAIDTVKKRTQRTRKPTVDSVELLPDRHDPEQRRLQDEREALHYAAGEVLSPRQQRIVNLSLEGYTVRDISQEMRLPPARVSDEKYKAVRRLRDFLAPAETVIVSSQ